MSKMKTKYILDASVDFVKKVVKEKHPDTNVIGAMLKGVIEAAGVKNPKITYTTKRFIGRTIEMLVIEANNSKSTYFLSID